MERAAARPRDGFVEANGLTLHYLDWGGGPGRPIVLLHGLRDQAHEWDTIAPALRPFGPVLAPDQRGHGGSDRPRDGYAPEDFAADLAGFCDALGFDRPVLIGHSLGGRTAYTFAGLHPDRPGALALIDIGAAGAPESIPALVAEMEAGYGPFASEDDAIRALIGDALAPNAATRAYVRHNLRRLPDGMLGWGYDLDAAIAAVRLGRGRDYWDLIARIRAPTLIVRGERSDVLSPADAGRLVRTIPGSTLAQIAGVGHLIPQLRPQELIRVITDWLRQLPPAAG